MRLDSLSFAAGPDGLKADVAKLSDLLGAKFRDGGVHPRFGTRNYILPLVGARYLEVVEVLDHPVAEKAFFGKAVRARQEAGGGWLTWVISVDDLGDYERRLGRDAALGQRRFPDGRLLEWHQIGLIEGIVAERALPYFIHWDSPEDVLPGALASVTSVSKLELSGSKAHVAEWIGAEIGDTFDGVEFSFRSPNGRPGLDAVTFVTADRRVVRI
ncbi:MAG: VOC family protein [Propionibacteriaceae bacterium]|jgi:hypothetical protein|nr:VOC family protein [Propionibacteriaceae bacterium]